MKVIRVFLLVLAALCCARISVAQELACKVTVNIQTLSEEERQIWQTFRADVEAYLNTYSWTTNFSGERIQCSVVFNITGANGSDYTAQVFIQSNRPLNQSKELTTMARFLDDKVTFGYSRGLPLQHGVNYRSLESLLDYYAYIIVGLDLDSYAPEGGTAPLQQAQTTALIANSSQGNGWDRIITASGAFSRFGYIESLLDANNRVLRDLYYSYHTTVLDEIGANPDLARNNYGHFIDTVIKLKRATSDIDRSVFFKTFCEAKYTEFSEFVRWFKDNADLYFRKIKFIDPQHITFYDAALEKMQ